MQQAIRGLTGRIASVLVALCLALAFVPTVAFAENATAGTIVVTQSTVAVAAGDTLSLSDYVSVSGLEPEDGDYHYDYVAADGTECFSVNKHSGIVTAANVDEDASSTVTVYLMEGTAPSGNSGKPCDGYTVLATQTITVEVAADESLDYGAQGASSQLTIELTSPSVTSTSYNSASASYTNVIEDQEAGSTVSFVFKQSAGYNQYLNYYSTWGYDSPEEAYQALAGAYISYEDAEGNTTTVAESSTIEVTEVSSTGSITITVPVGDVTGTGTLRFDADLHTFQQSDTTQVNKSLGVDISFVFEIVAACEHDYVAVVTDPTCTEAGYTTYTCSICGDTYVADEVAATGHTAADAVTENEVEATCTEDGSYDTVVYCSVCGEELSRETTAVAATGHSYEVTATVEATATTDGSITYTCSVCGDTYTETVPATGVEVTYDYFTDVQSGVQSDSLVEAVYSLAAYGYVTGTTDTTYSPDVSTTRAMMVTILWRIMEPEAYAAYDQDAAVGATFADVADGKYYTAAVEWAVEQGITKGTSDTEFSPNATCTFEQFCTFVARAINGGDDATNAAVSDAEAATILAQFSDGADTGKSYDNSVAFLAEAGIVSGYSNGTLLPGEDLGRGRMAQLTWKTISAGYLA